MRLNQFVIFAAVAAFSAPLAAQSVGMQVIDTAGAPVGTIAAINGDNLLVKTGKHEILLPKTSFTAANGKLLFGMSQAQLDSQFEASMAASNAAVAVGSSVNGVGGTGVGTIEAVADDKVTIALSSGAKLVLPKAGVRGNSDGTVTVGYTADQLEQLVKQSAPVEASTGE